jgi:hypothetical protein
MKYTFLNEITMFKRILDFISEYWHIATTKSGLYEYIIEDIQIQERENALTTLIYYRAIGARALMYDSAFDLNGSDVFLKFSHAHAQVIVTLSTLERMMRMDQSTLIANYKGYVKQCAKILRSQKKK